jgi:hypothetical protein
MDPLLLVVGIVAFVIWFALAWDSRHHSRTWENEDD